MHSDLFPSVPRQVLHFTVARMETMYKDHIWWLLKYYSLFIIIYCKTEHLLTKSFPELDLFCLGVAEFRAMQAISSCVNQLYTQTAWTACMKSKTSGFDGELLGGLVCLFSPIGHRVKHKG